MSEDQEKKIIETDLIDQYIVGFRHRLSYNLIQKKSYRGPSQSNYWKPNRKGKIYNAAGEETHYLKWPTIWLTYTSTEITEARRQWDISKEL